jgi:hypothetical protein
MTDVSLNSLKIAKLNGSNYRTWSFNMRLYLESLDLFEYADGTAETPGSSATENVYFEASVLVRRKRGLISV